jgi:hypothetical protein
VVARIVLEGSSSPPGDWPDFAALRKEIFGERVLPGADVVIEEAAAIDRHLTTYSAKLALAVGLKTG